MINNNLHTLLAAVCDFGWGSLGKLRLILDQLAACPVALYGDAPINALAADLLGARHAFVNRPPESATVALVINDPAAADRIAGLGVPVIYVDSLPYLWANEGEVPGRRNVAYYCAQKFPTDRMPVSPQLLDRPIHWIDPIVPTPRHRTGGEGVVINLGGLHSHLAGDTVDAYLRLVLLPLVGELKAAGRDVSAVCGNLPADICGEVQSMLPACRFVGRQTPYDFEALLRGADLLVSSPGSTTILQAISLRLPTLLLPPQNLSQIFNARLFSTPGAPTMDWPSSVMSAETIDRLRPQGEDAVLIYIYKSISDAARSARATADVTATIQAAVRGMPGAGVLDSSLSSLGRNGAAQVAQLIKQAMLAPILDPTRATRPA